MTEDTAALLLDILAGFTLQVGAPDFDQVAPRIIAAKAQLRAIVEGDPS
jgi:hypothetical protein